MQLSGEHNSPLSLICGEDRRLLWIGRLVTLFAVTLLIAGHLPFGARLAFALATLAYWWHAERRIRSISGLGLRIHPSGHSEMHGVAGQVKQRAWVSKYYTVLQLEQEGAIVISASRQHPDEYRKLLAWMRHQRWTIPALHGKSDD